MNESWVICGLKSQLRPDGTTEWTWVGRQPVSDAEVAAAQDAIAVLVEDSEQKQLNLVLDNFKSFFGYLALVPREFESARREAVNPVIRVQTELATRLFNWLQSIRAYLDHTERRLNRRYGDESLELTAFKEATAKKSMVSLPIASSISCATMVMSTSLRWN